MDDAFLSKVRKLAAVGRAQDLEFDGVVARVAVDEFCRLARPTQVEVERFVFVMSQSLPKTDAAQAARIAEILAPRAAVPEIVLARLIERGAVAATTVLQQAPHLSTTLLLARAAEGSGAEAAAIASRRDLDRPVVAALARRPEPEALRALVMNRSADMDHGALLALIQRGRVDAALARALLQRADLGLRALPLFLAADGDARRDMMVDAQRDELTRPPHRESPLEAIRASALSAANAGNAREFARTIALALKAGRASVDRMIEDSGGEPLALLFAAIGANAAAAADAMAMLRTAGALHDKPNVRIALDMRPSAAWRIVAAITGSRTSPQEIARFAAAPRGEGLLAAPSAAVARRATGRVVNRA